MTDKVSPFVESLDQNEYARILKIVEKKNEEDEKHELSYSTDIMDKSLNTITTEISNILVNFVNDYGKKVDEASEYAGTGPSPVVTLKQYSYGLILYLRETDKLYYFGIIFILLSILIYFFSITLL